jgi:hypothetical protein
VSGRVAAQEAIRRVARTAAQRHMAVRRATVLSVNPLVVQPFTYLQTLTDNEMTLSQWAQFYDHVAGIEAGDLVLVQQEEADWVLLDVVSGKNANKLFDHWKSS